MNLLQQLANIPGESILVQVIRSGAEQGLLEGTCELIYTQGCDNDRMMREVVGSELYEACIDHHCQHIEISIL